MPVPEFPKPDEPPLHAPHRQQPEPTPVIPPEEPEPEGLPEPDQDQPERPPPLEACRVMVGVVRRMLGGEGGSLSSAGQAEPCLRGCADADSLVQAPVPVCPTEFPQPQPPDELPRPSPLESPLETPPEIAPGECPPEMSF